MANLFHKLRADRERDLAPRTIHNIYTVVPAMFRDAMLADLIEQSPCILDEHQLGSLVDKDPEWRNEVVARVEVNHSSLPSAVRNDCAFRLLGIRRVDRNGQPRCTELCQR